MFIIDEHDIRVNNAMNKINKNTEERIFRLAAEAFRKNVPWLADIRVVDKEPAYRKDYRPDFRIKMEAQGKIFVYDVEIKANFTRANRFQYLMHKEKLDHPLLIIANYINPQLADQLKQDGLEFIDTAGNAFINNPPLHIFIKGNRPHELLKQPPVDRAFKPAGMKMVFAFLCNPGFENKTYREIATETNVALGTVNWIMKDLAKLGYLLDMGKRGRRIVQKEKLLNQWANAYPLRLRPKQWQGRYKGEKEWWRRKTLDPIIAQWGGEVAAERLTHYLKPGFITIYIAPAVLNPFLLENRLKRDAAGDVEILERFWTPEGIWEKNEFVHPILVYADLLATGDQRDIETAKIIHDQHIVRYIRED